MAAIRLIYGSMTSNIEQMAQAISYAKRNCSSPDNWNSSLLNRMYCLWSRAAQDVQRSSQDYQ
ncbi:hypothetical protein BVG16_08145 [Paenibacillus selenitireducens]|uniref:Uncharacterized protein n=1 Tax=Paenibacillus selenitireducens TaxID=1324314 RepID=A0A1T2XGV5_9BACL|nr:flavodoxin family protein [Paenibacillus selenitireducens]OPA79065.1 hypothetical protein BVG16_08145 [Paenibacillus selenitireducens]